MVGLITRMSFPLSRGNNAEVIFLVELYYNNPFEIKLAVGRDTWLQFAEPLSVKIGLPKRH